MTDRDKLILENPEKMCEYCCNFDKEHIGMDCTAFCKLTMTLAYAEDYGGNCMFYNVPKEQIILPPCKVGQTVYIITEVSKTIWEGTVIGIWQCASNTAIITEIGTIHNDSLGKTVFLTREEAEKMLKGEGK